MNTSNCVLSDCFTFVLDGCYFHIFHFYSIFEFYRVQKRNMSAYLMPGTPFQPLDHSFIIPTFFIKNFTRRFFGGPFCRIR